MGPDIAGFAKKQLDSGLAGSEIQYIPNTKYLKLSYYFEAIFE